LGTGPTIAGKMGIGANTGKAATAAAIGTAGGAGNTGTFNGGNAGAFNGTNAGTLAGAANGTLIDRPIGALPVPFLGLRLFSGKSSMPNKPGS
jgi:hypothetical protein